MRGKRLSRPFLVFIAVCILFVLFLSLYFFPSLRSINRTRRQTRDQLAEITRFVGSGGEAGVVAATDQSAYESLWGQLRERMASGSSPLTFVDLNRELDRFIRKGAARFGINDCQWTSFQSERESWGMYLMGEIRLLAKIKRTLSFCRYILDFPVRLEIDQFGVDPGTDGDQIRIHFRIPVVEKDAFPYADRVPVIDMDSPLLNVPLLPQVSLSPSGLSELSQDCIGLMDQTVFPGWRKRESKK